jgi:hypothetical protein
MLNGGAREGCISKGGEIRAEMYQSHPFVRIIISLLYKTSHSPWSMLRRKPCEHLRPGRPLTRIKAVSKIGPRKSDLRLYRPLIRWSVQ